MTDLEKDKRIAWLETELKSLKHDYEKCAKGHEEDAQNIATMIANSLIQSPGANVSYLLLKYQLTEASRKNCMEFTMYLDSILKGHKPDEWQ